MTKWKRCVVERVPNGYVLHSFSAGDSEVWLNGEIRVVPDSDTPGLAAMLQNMLQEGPTDDGPQVARSEEDGGRPPQDRGVHPIWGSAFVRLGLGNLTGTLLS